MESTIFGLSARELIDAVRSVSFASTDETFRHALHCTHWRIEDGKLTLTATDGKRLVRTYIWADYKGPTYETTVATKDCRKLAGMLTKTATGLRVELCHGAADFSWTQTSGKNKGDRTFSCKENLARFPKCDPILDDARKNDSSFLHVVIVDRELAAGDTNSVVFDPKKKRFDRRASVRGVEIRKVDGDVTDICFDLDFVVDWSTYVVGEGVIKLAIKDNGSAVYTQHGVAEYVFMPMNQD